ncbi:MAG TPA: beta-N-acetylhexosaminidase [Steroidobacteraceae bacterium]|nr:beta-N-acetylhexosaminidase [Steroidobacteraceae bacterium]
MDVIPAPAQVVAHSGAFLLRNDTPLLVAADQESQRLGVYLAGLLRASHGFALRVRSADAKPAAPIELRLDPAAPPGSETYRLQVTESLVRVSARERAGLFYGAVTLWQLCSAQHPGGATLKLPTLDIIDAPRFRWRGLMLDSARHFQSPEFVMRYIDWMALHKLNVLSWHLTDDQGWRLEIHKYPRLTSVGAWRVPAGRAAQRDIDPATGRPRLYGGFYTQAQVRRIVAHARARYVTIVPEIDLPAHATAALVAYPTLAAQPGELPRAVPADWGIYPHLLNIDEATFRFVEDVLDEVMALFPGPFVHVGGDEVLTGQWQGSPAVRARMQELGIADTSGVQGYFERRLGDYLSAHGRRLAGWDEILGAGLGANATVLSWRGVQGALVAAQAGHDTVLAPDPLMYLDHRQGAAPQEPPGRGAVITTADLYHFEVLPGELAALSQHVLGVQANLWTEHVRTEERAAYMTWPRAAALAEVAWSPQASRDWDNFLARLPAEFDRYRTLGIHYSADVFAPPRHVAPFERHMSQDLKTCTDKVVLNLEDDAPRVGARAVFLIDIENPCWILPAADLTQARSLTVAVGQVPFNFQIGRDRDAIRFDTPHTAAGELEVRADGCDGAPLALLPLAPAADHDAVTVLPRVALPPLTGNHELCLRFAQPGLDPLWAIDWLQLSP